MILTILMFLLLPTPALASPSWWGTVTQVIDGDTIIVSQFGTEVELDLDTIDALELDQPFGREAADSIRALIKGKKVRVAPRGKDKHGRLRAEVFSEHGLSLSIHLLESGHARWDREQAPGCGVCEHVEEKARRFKRVGWRPYRLLLTNPG